INTERPARSAIGLVGCSPVTKTAFGAVCCRTWAANCTSSVVNQTYAGPCGGRNCSSESAPDATTLSQIAAATTAPAPRTRASRTSRAPTATALAMYQKTSSLLLSQSHGWNLIRLATRNTRLKGAISSRIRPRNASGLSRASSSSGQNRTVFLSQNQGGKSEPDTHPISQRGYW